jgi:hypothetical protein
MMANLIRNHRGSEDNGKISTKCWGKVTINAEF